MAEAIVSIALKKLTQTLGQQIQLFAGASDELERLKATFQSIEAVLADAESRQVEEKSSKLWLSMLSTIGCYHLPMIRMMKLLEREIKEIRGRLDDIAKDKDQFNPRQISSSFDGDTRPAIRSQTMTSSHMNEQMIGRDDDKETVINWLVSGSGNSTGDGEYGQQQQVEVIAIFGIGGVGKTTLARKIYHDSKVQGHFKGFLYWVCVSQDFDLRRLLKAIIEQVKRAATSLTELDSLQKELIEQLRGKCFLHVLDDVWNSDKRRWNALQPCLAIGAPGSRILVTTRLQVVAENTMNASHIRELKGLSDDHSWTLFSSIAFDGRTEEECSDQLESVGREIVGKCKGVPLSITVMGSVMNSKRTVEDWQNILDSKMWSLSEAESKILPGLLLSYYNLPPHLKQCFVYHSIFPEDEEMDKDELVKLWVAQGFVESQGTRDIEDIGAEYVDDLVAWSMLHEQVNENGRTIYTMHDLLHDLAKFIAKGEIYSSIGSQGGTSAKESSHKVVRHAISHFTEDKNIPATFSRAKKLRTLLLVGEVDETNGVIVDLFHQARFLRVLFFRPSTMFPKAICKLKHLRYLNLSDSQVAKLPNAIGKLKQLRYLVLSYLSIVALPESVSHLCNLHTLNLCCCQKLERLPTRMGKMVSLRYLEIDGTDSLECLPEGLGGISYLRSLCKFIVEGKGGCGIHELLQLNALEGSLEIHHLERVPSQEEAEKAELWKKPKVRRLVLYMSDAAANIDIERRVNVLEGLRPHANLKELKLNCYSRSSKLRVPSWIEDSSFSKLTELTIEGLVNYCDPKILPGIGKLPALKSLKVKKVGIRKLGHEFYYGNSSSSSCAIISTAAFPKLEELYLWHLDELEEWESPTMATIEGDDAIVKEIIIMPSLCKLVLAHCPRLEGLPDLLSSAPLKFLAIDCCDRLEGRGCSFPFLEEFFLHESSEFFSGGLPNLSNLKTFKIDSFRNGRLSISNNGGWEQLVALQKLQISRCGELTSLPHGLTQLESLEDFEISYCRKLESLPEALGQLKKLKKLDMSGLRALTNLPALLGELESLEHLSISQLGKLESLPHSLGQLKALDRLHIGNCQALASLPDGLRHLSLLQVLVIEDCPLLSERCKREEGVDWPKISHIPNINIDGQWIQYSD